MTHRATRAQDDRHDLVRYGMMDGGGGATKPAEIGSTSADGAPPLANFA